MAQIATHSPHPHRIHPSRVCHHGHPGVCGGRTTGKTIHSDGQPPQLRRCGNDSSQDPGGFCGPSRKQVVPIIGWGATLLGTIWVNRKSKESRKETRESVKQRLQDGFGIVIFPEGTTHMGPDVLEYRPSMFYISAEGGFPVTPIAIEYKDPNIAWVGQAKFVPHAWKQFGAKHIDVKVSYGPTYCLPDGGEMLEKTRAWTEKEVMRLRNEWDQQIAEEQKG